MQLARGSGVLGVFDLAKYYWCVRLLGLQRAQGPVQRANIDTSLDRTCLSHAMAMIFLFFKMICDMSLQIFLGGCQLEINNYRSHHLQDTIHVEMMKALHKQQRVTHFQRPVDEEMGPLRRRLFEMEKMILSEAPRIGMSMSNCLIN